MKGSSKPRAGAVRKAKGKQVGSGGQGRQALEGKGPTPKAEDRAWHPAGKRKAAEERYRASGGKGRAPGKVAGQGQRAIHIFVLAVDGDDDRLRQGRRRQRRAGHLKQGFRAGHGVSSRAVR